MTNLLLVAFVFLIAGVLAVPIASRFGLGSVLGYLIAGILISPVLYAMNIDVIAIQHIAEFGVVMMLFIVGLELEPRMLWQMRNRLLGLGGLQVGLTMAAITGFAILFGQPWTVALAIGMVLSLSSTAIVLQTLNEKGLMKSDGGQASFSVLLFQDIAVIPMLALLPLLAMPELMDAVPAVAADAAHGRDDQGHSEQMSLIAHLNGWQQALATFGAVAAVILGGHYLVRPLFRYIAMANLREIFVGAALMLVVGIALLMSLVGLSAALGTFLAGVVLATSEFRHELESDINPFKGLLLGLFFITVGASINFTLLLDNVLLITGLTLGLIALKAGILFVLSLVFKVRSSNGWLFSLGLAQAGEFGFVLLSFTVANQVIPNSVSEKLLLVVALSMLLTPALFIAFDKLIAPRFSNAGDQKDRDDIDHQANTIVLGIGRFGSVVNRVLTSSGHSTVVVDYNANHLETFRKLGIKAFYGDASRADLLHAAGIENAKYLVIAIDDEHQITQIVKHVKALYPKVHIVARAVDRHHVYDLYQAGANDIIRESFDSATRAARSTLEAMGMEREAAQQKINDFVEFDQYMMLEAATVYKPGVAIAENPEYLQKVKQLIPLEGDVMQGKRTLEEIKQEMGAVDPVTANPATVNPS